MISVREGVDDRHTGSGRQLLDGAVLVPADDDALHEAGEHPGGVGGRLPAAHLHARLPAGGQEEAVAAELGDADLERDAGARGLLGEDQGERLARERVAVRRRVLLHGVRELEDTSELARGEIHETAEVTRHRGDGVARRRTGRKAVSDR